MPLYLNKVVNMKLTLAPEGQQEFETAFQNAFEFTRFLFNEIPCWGLDAVYVRDMSQPSPPLKDLVAQRRALYDATDRSVSFGDFSAMLKVLYRVVLEASSRSALPLIIGHSKDTEVLADMAEVHGLLANWVAAPPTNILKKIGNKLTAMGFRNRFPRLELSAGERCSVMANVSRMLTSWDTCNKRTQEAYAAEIVEIDRCVALIPPQIRAGMMGLFDICLADDIVHHFDPRVTAYTRDCIIPALVAGEPPEKHFYLRQRDERKIAYSLAPGYFNYLRGCPMLWNGADPEMLKHLYVLELIIDHRRHVPGATYPYMHGESQYRYQYCLGTNYSDYRLVATGAAQPDCQAFDSAPKIDRMCEFVTGAVADHLNVRVSRGKTGSKITARVHTRDVRHGGNVNPSQYFADLRVWQLKGNACTNLLEFKRRGTTVKALVKEPVIVKTRNGFELRINMTAGIEGDATANMDLKNFLSSALPEHAETEKNVERLQRLNGKTFRILGVDLGLCVPFAWAVGEITVTQSVNPVVIVNSGAYRGTANNSYYELSQNLASLRRVMGMVRSTAGGSDCAEDWNEDVGVAALISTAQTGVTTQLAKTTSPRKVAAFQAFIAETDHYAAMCALLAAHGGNLEEMKKDPKFIGGVLLQYLYRRFGAIKEARRMHFATGAAASTKLDDEFKWLDIISGMKAATRRLSYLGSDNNRDATLLPALSEYYTGCKDNLLKQLAAGIVKTAMEQNCGIIAIEDLGVSPTQASLNKKQDNFLFALWSPTRVHDAIVNAASWYGIEVMTVSEAMTSQVHFETQTLGYRDRRVLHYMTTTGLGSVDADINAAKNLANRAATRHADLKQIYIPALFEDPQSAVHTDGAHPAKAKRARDKNKVKKTDPLGVRMRGFLTHAFGSVAAARVAFTGVTSPYVYRDGNAWLTVAEKNDRVKAIKEVVAP